MRYNKILVDIFPSYALSFMDAIVDEDSRVSFITKNELLAWNPPIPEDIEIRGEFLDGSEIHLVDDEIIKLAIKIKKETNIKIPDALIA